MAFQLPELPYPYDSLGPYMSAETLEYHHDKHHKAYVDKGNELAKAAGMENKNLEEIVVASFKDKSQAGLFNNAGQHWNHLHFWNWMKPSGGGRKLPAYLQKAVDESFGGFDDFRGKFIEAGTTQFGSGWAWLTLESDGRLGIMKTPNGENPLAHGKTAILGVDVWEHSYYIDYRNARPKYLEAFIDNLVNWDHVVELFEKGPAKIAA
jgi:Fe-Mn family superoxide dismutase